MNRDFTDEIAKHEAAKATDRLAETPPAYAAVRIAADSVDMDRDLLAVRVERIIDEVRDLASEALRIRDQHEVQITALQAIACEAAKVVPPPSPPTIVEPALPPTLIHWIRRQVALHPVAADHYPVLVQPNVTLGELRAFLSAYDKDVK